MVSEKLLFLKRYGGLVKASKVRRYNSVNSFFYCFCTLPAKEKGSVFCFTFLMYGSCDKNFIIFSNRHHRGHICAKKQLGEERRIAGPGARRRSEK